MLSVIDDISKYFVRQIIQGVTIDLRDFFDSNNLVKNYEIKTTEDEKYIISVYLTEFNQSKTKDVFFRLLRYINYDSTFYVSEATSDSIIYYLLSSTLENDLGFYFEIRFCQG